MTSEQTHPLSQTERPGRAKQKETKRTTMKDAKKDKPRKGTTSHLLSYIFAYKWQMIVVVLCIIISAAANAAMGFFLQTLIDSYIMPQVGKSHPDFLPLAQGLGVLAIVFTAGGHRHPDLQPDPGQGGTRGAQDH